MQKSYTIKILCLQTIAFFAYLICTYINLDILQETLSSICIAVSAGILINAYNEIEKSILSRTSWLMFFVGYVFWIVGDILSLVYKLQGSDPHNAFPVIMAYVGTSAFFVIGIISFTLTYYKKWNGILLFLDMFVSLILTFILACQFYLCIKSVEIWTISPSDLLALVSLILDTFIIVNAMDWHLYIKIDDMPSYLRITAGGFLLYSLTDIFNNYMKLNGRSSAAALISALYMISFIAIAAGSFLRMQNSDHKLQQVESIDNFNIVRKFMVMLLYPIAALIMNEFIFNSYLLNEMIGYTVVFVCYFVARLCAYKYMEAQRLFEKEAELRSSIQNEASIQMQELSRLVNEDSVTELYNRRFFLEKLNNEIEKRKQSEVVFVMMINVSRFKAINDIYGHYVGDMVLKQIGDRIKEWNTIGATIARYGEDKFTLFYRGENSNDKISSLASTLIEYIARPIVIDENEITICISMGISVCPTYACEGNLLLQYADAATCRAKAAGINKHVFFDPVFSECVRKKNELGFLLEKAVKENKFMVYYQPQFTLPGIELTGAEALIRWNDEKYGFIPPDEFIPIAEELGIIKEMDSWVSRKAFSQVVEWNNRCGVSLKVGVNISPNELAEDDFIALLEKTLEETKVDPKWTNIEVTENIVLEDSDRMDRIFDFFTDMGMTVAVDDFGTGYSSVNYLNKYPFSYIKIDKSLIDKISTSESDRKIVAVIIAMSKALNMKTIAEGVETKEQVDILIDMGCDQVQGFMFGRPVPSGEFEEKYLYQYMKNHVINE